MLPSAYKTIFIGKYLQSPFLEPIDYSYYPALYEKLLITVRVWIFPAMSAVITPIFILIGMGIVFRQKWARILLLILCSLQLLFTAVLLTGAAFFNPVWMAKSFGAPYYDEILWFAVIPALCIFVFTRPRIKREFNRAVMINKIKEEKGGTRYV